MEPSPVQPNSLISARLQGRGLRVQSPHGPRHLEAFWDRSLGGRRPSRNVFGREHPEALTRFT